VKELGKGVGVDDLLGWIIVFGIRLYVGVTLDWNFDLLIILNFFIFVQDFLD
jgi:hypothetical protein